MRESNPQEPVQNSSEVRSATVERHRAAIAAGEVYEHWIYASEQSVLAALAVELAEYGYAVPAAGWPWPGMTSPTMPLVSADCAQAGCTGCPTHWLLVVRGSVDIAFEDGGIDDIEKACARVGALYDGGEMTVSATPDEVEVMFAQAREVVKGLAR